MWEISLDISKQLGKLIISYQNHKEAYGQMLVECQTLQQQPPEVFYQKVFLKFFAKLQKNTCVGVSKVANLSSSLKNRL